MTASSGHMCHFMVLVTLGEQFDCFAQRLDAFELSKKQPDLLLPKVKYQLLLRLPPGGKRPCQRGHGPSLLDMLPCESFRIVSHRYAILPKVMKRSLFLAFIELVIYTWRGGSETPVAKL